MATISGTAYVDPYRTPMPVAPVTSSVTTTTPGIPSTPASSGTPAQPSNTQTTGNSASSGSSSGASSSQKDGNTVSDRTSSNNQNVQNMSPETLRALEELIAQLSAGGTPQMLADRAVKNGEISTLQNSRAGFSREAALGDAQGLMSQTMRQTLEKLLPSINGGALGAGASQSSMRALLVQKAGENAAEAAAAQGLAAVSSYGNVANGMSSVLAGILGQSDPATSALLNAFNIAKGAVQNVSGSTAERATGTTSERGTGTTTGVENKAASANDNKGIQYTGGTPATPAIAGTGSSSVTTTGIPGLPAITPNSNGNTLGAYPPGVTPPIQGPSWTYNGPVDNGMGNRPPSGVAGIPADVLAEIARGNNGSFGDTFQF